MEWKIIDSQVEITCTFDELVTMDSNDLAIYGTPNQDGQACQFYKASSRNWQDDFVVATVSSFCEAEGWDSLGWEEMDEATLDSISNDETTIVVSRYKAVD